MLARQILDQGLLRTAFLPAVSIRRSAAVAWEALVRGPDSSVSASLPLLRAAHEEGITVEFELRAIRHAIERFRASGESTQLWLNLNSDLLGDLTYLSAVQTTLFELRVSSQIVLLTARPTLGANPNAFPRLVHSLQTLAPFRVVLAFDEIPDSPVAIDYLQNQEGFGYLKLGRHLIGGIAGSALKRVHVQDLAQRAQHRGVRVIAEGVETEAELQLVASLGVELVQGFVFGRPTDPPQLTLRPLEALRRSGAEDTELSTNLVEALEPAPVFFFQSTRSLLETYARNHPGTVLFPVLEDNYPIGYVTSADLDAWVEGEPLESVLSDDLLVVEAHDDPVEVLAEWERCSRAPAVCVVWDGIYQGIVPVSKLRRGDRA